MMSNSGRTNKRRKVRYKSVRIDRLQGLSKEEQANQIKLQTGQIPRYDGGEKCFYINKV